MKQALLLLLKQNRQEWREVLSRQGFAKISTLNVSHNFVGVDFLDVILDCLSPAHLQHLVNMTKDHYGV